jgi:hypothetical protein
VGRSLGLLCADLAQIMCEQVTGTPDTGSINAFLDEALKVKGDGYYDDWYGRFYEGSHLNTTFNVTDFDGDTGEIKFIPPLSSENKVDNTDLYYMTVDYTPEELIGAINQAIVMVEDEALEDELDETVLVIASTYEYPIPSTFSYIDTVIQESTADSGKFSVSGGKIKKFNILRGGQRKLWFDPSVVSLTAGRKLRLVGQKKPKRLTADSDICEISPAFLLQQAKAILHQSRIKGEGSDFEEHRSQMGIAQGMANDARRRIQVPSTGWPI